MKSPQRKTRLTKVSGKVVGRRIWRDRGESWGPKEDSKALAFAQVEENLQVDLSERETGRDPM